MWPKKLMKFHRQPAFAVALATECQIPKYMSSGILSFSSKPSYYLWNSIKGPSSKKCQKSPQKRAQKSKLLFWVAQKSILLKKVLKKVNSLFWVLKIVLFKVTFIKCCSKKGSKKLLSQKSTQKRAFMIEFPQKRALKSESLKKEN